MILQGLRGGGYLTNQYEIGCRTLLDFWRGDGKKADELEGQILGESRLQRGRQCVLDLDRGRKTTEDTEPSV